MILTLLLLENALWIKFLSNERAAPVKTTRLIAWLTIRHEREHHDSSNKPEFSILSAPSVAR